MCWSRARQASWGLSAERQSTGGDVADESKIQMYDPERPRLERVRPELVEVYPEEAADSPDLRGYWRTIQKRRWTVLSILLVTLTITSIVTWRKSPFTGLTRCSKFKKRMPIFRPFRSCSSWKTSRTTIWRHSTRSCKARLWRDESSVNCTLSAIASSIHRKNGWLQAKSTCSRAGIDHRSGRPTGRPARVQRPAQRRSRPAQPLGSNQF